MTKTVQSVLAEMRAQFESIGLATPNLDARLLVQGVLEMSHEELILNPDSPVTESDGEKLAGFMRRRMLREPVSRILGVRSFWRAEFKVSPDTLDPRPDSETLVEAVLKNVDKESPLRILDLGTGTGCLLLSLLQELPQATGMGIDISAGAIQTAQLNAMSLNTSALHLSERALFITSDWTHLKMDTSFDIVISNPPYIPDAAISHLEPEVSQYEPKRALSGGADGLDCYRSISRTLPRLLAKHGKIFLEIGSTQAESVKEILAGRGFHVLQTVMDIAGHDRCIIAHR